MTDIRRNRKHAVLVGPQQIQPPEPPEKQAPPPEQKLDLVFQPFPALPEDKHFEEMPHNLGGVGNNFQPRFDIFEQQPMRVGLFLPVQPPPLPAEENQEKKENTAEAESNSTDSHPKL